MILRRSVQSASQIFKVSPSGGGGGSLQNTFLSGGRLSVCLNLETVNLKVSLQRACASLTEA